MKNGENEKRFGVSNAIGRGYERNNHFYGKLMTVRDYKVEQNYINEKRWLINRMVNGSGIVSGLKVSLTKDSDDKVTGFSIQPGLALDKCGREIIVYEEYRHTFEKEITESCFICIEYHECETEPLEILPISCNQDKKHQFNRIKDSFNVLVLTPEELECYEKDICSESTEVHSPACPLEDKTTSLHKYLCDKITNTDADACVACNYIILGTLKYEEDNDISLDEDCSDNPLVYSNPTLYEMLECYHGNIPHIVEIGWKNFHAKTDVCWDEFVKIVENKLTITFDRLMNTETINKHTFLFVAITSESATGYRRMKYIPGSIESKKGTWKGKDVTKTTFKVEADWKADEIERSHSEIKDGAEFEIILRGNSILSKDGRALDGTFINFLNDKVSGNGVQGGEFMSWFEVKPSADEECKKQENITFDDLCDKFLKTIDVHNYSKSWLVRVKGILKKHSARWGILPIDTITTDDIENWISEQINNEAAKSTINNESAPLRKMFQMAVEKGFITETPFKNVGFLKLPEPEPKYLKPKEFHLLLDIATGYDERRLIPKYSKKGGAPISIAGLPLDEIKKGYNLFTGTFDHARIKFLGLVGLRKMQFIDLKWKQYDFESGVLTLKPTHEHSEKSKRTTRVSLPIAAKEILEGQPRISDYVFPNLQGNRDLQFTQRLKRGIFKRFEKQTKKHIHLHMLRHTAFTYLLQYTGDIELVRKFAGHQKTETTQIYARIIQEEMTKKVADFNY